MGNSRRPCRGCRFLSRSALSAVLLACGSISLQADTDEVSHVQLDCEIVSSHPDTAPGPWAVELRKANGDPLFQAVKITGDTVKVKNLNAGVYELCIIGKQSARCQSIDMYPPAPRRVYTFKIKMSVPEGGTGELVSHSVSLTELSIPKEARQEMSRSEQAEFSGDSKDAFEHLERALAIDPDYPDALNNMGVHYYHLRDYARSTGYLTKATEINPNYCVAWANLGTSLLALGNFKDALKVNQRALDLRPNDARSNFQLGLTYYYMRSYAEATKYFRRAGSLDPLLAGAPQLFLAEIAILQGKQDDAEAGINDFLQRHPNCPLKARLMQVLREVKDGHPTNLPSIDLSNGP